MRRRLSMITLTLLSAVSAEATTMTMPDIVDALRRPGPPEETFEVVGTMVFRRTVRSLCVVCSDGASATLKLTGCAAGATASPGDTVHLRGKIVRDAHAGTTMAYAEEMEVFRRGPPPCPKSATVPDLLGEELENKYVNLRATVQDVYSSETNPRFVHLMLKDGSRRMLATVPAPEASHLDPKSLQEAQIDVCGVCVRQDYSPRRQIGKVFLIATWSAIRVLRPPPEDPFDVENIDDLSGQSPETITSTGRRSVRGRVLAVLAASRRILLLAKNGLVNVDMADGRLPPFGSEIDVVGFPATDLFRININRARWRKVPGSTPMAPKTPERIAAKDLFLVSGTPGINTRMHGRAISLRGTVKAIPDDVTGERLVHIESDGILVAVDADSVPEIKADFAVGSVLDVSGICFVRTSNWGPNEEFPRADGFILAVRTPSDVLVVKRPPWWTPRRILFAAVLLIVLVAMTVFWNIAVHRLAEKRGRALFKEHIARATAELRVKERTRLAIELHDSLSQNLSGIALQMESVERTMDREPERARHCLTTAVALLRSCRDELRNCLYDLRSRALEATDLEDAVRLTVRPHLGETKLDIRFSIARERLSDTTAHAFLRIVRELVVNAVRHGRAGRIWIAGSFEHDGLSFSVRDDGCGFDPANRPGISTGHCGLAGIRERVKRLGGRLDIDSALGRGTRVAVKIRGTEA